MLGVIWLHGYCSKNKLNTNKNKEIEFYARPIFDSFFDNLHAIHTINVMANPIFSTSHFSVLSLYSFVGLTVVNERWKIG